LTESPTDENFTVRHVHPAPRDLVFECLTTPDHLTHFWGPTGTHTPVENIVVDLRPGGAFETTMVSDGTTEVVTTQRGLPPHMRTPEARAGWGTALQRAATYIAAIAAPEVGS
jgi:uncharacterized protein YndB with AHSA1/START domain